MDVDKEKKEEKGASPYMQNDEFVKNFLSRKETAESFFQNYLPADIIRYLDFASLRISKDTFVDQKMSEFFSDLLYEINLRETSAFIYFLIEHKSDQAPLVDFQLLKYLVNIWELYLKQHEGAKKLPVIIPILIYHGEGEWKIDTQFITLFDVPEAVMPHVREYIPNFNYKLFDISHLRDEEIVGKVDLRILFLTLKYIFTPELRFKLPEILQLCNDLEDKNKGTEYIEILLRYMVRKLPDIMTDTIVDTVSKIIDGGGDIMPTIAESWEAKGEARGEAKGEARGEARGRENTTWEIIKKSLKKGLPISTIAEITGFSKEQINLMKKEIAKS